MQKQLVVQLWVLLRLTDVKALPYIRWHEADLIVTVLSVVLCECIAAIVAHFECIFRCCHSPVFFKSIHFAKKKPFLCADICSCWVLLWRLLEAEQSLMMPLHFITCAPVCVFWWLVVVRVCEPLCCRAWQHLLSSPALQDDLITFTLSPLTAFDRHFARLKAGVKSQSRLKRHVTVSEEWKAPIVN